MGASDYLVKPLSVRVLKATIRGILNKSRRRPPPEK
jgi:DNA-binding response OmpR family regulator